MSRPAKKQALQKLAGDPDPDVPPEDDAEDDEEEQQQEDAEAAPAPAEAAPAPSAASDSHEDLSELPTPRQSQEQISARAYEVMKQRGVTQTAVCIQLSLSPVYLSMWLSTPGGPVTPDQLAASAAAGSHTAAPPVQSKRTASPSKPATCTAPPSSCGWTYGRLPS